MECISNNKSKKWTKLTSSANSVEIVLTVFDYFSLSSSLSVFSVIVWIATTVAKVFFCSAIFDTMDLN